MMRQLYDPLNSVMYGLDDSFIQQMIGGACYSKTEIDTKLSAVLKLCGTKATASELPSSGNEVGDVWIISDESAEYAWVKSLKWERLGPVINLEPYATKDWTNNLVGAIPSQYESVVAYIQSVATVAGAALPRTEFQTFQSSNSTAIADAKKAGTDAAAALQTYRSSNDTAVSNAKSAGVNAQTAIDNFKTAQLVFEETAQSIEALINSTTKEETEDVKFSRYKTYFKKVNGEYVELVLGTDYDATNPVADFGEAVYEEVSDLNVANLVSKINELVSAGNTLIVAHKQQQTEEDNGEGE